MLLSASSPLPLSECLASPQERLCPGWALDIDDDDEDDDDTGEAVEVEEVKVEEIVAEAVPLDEVDGTDEEEPKAEGKTKVGLRDIGRIVEGILPPVLE